MFVSFAIPSSCTYMGFIYPPSSEAPGEFVLHCDLSVRGGCVRLAAGLGVLLLV